MTNKQLESEIIKALDINSNVDWITTDPNKEFKELKKFVKKLETKGLVKVEGSNMLYTKGGVSKTELYMQYTGRTLESVTESNTYPSDIAMFQLAPIYANNNQNAVR